MATFSEKSLHSLIQFPKEITETSSPLLPNFLYSIFPFLNIGYFDMINLIHRFDDERF